MNDIIINHKYYNKTKKFIEKHIDSEYLNDDAKNRLSVLYQDLDWKKCDKETYELVLEESGIIMDEYTTYKSTQIIPCGMFTVKISQSYNESEEEKKNYSIKLYFSFSGLVMIIIFIIALFVIKLV